MVALNFKDVGIEQLINYGMFRKNGGTKCGYVLKTEKLLDPEFLNILKMKMRFKLISAQNLGHLVTEESNKQFVFIEVEVVDMGVSSGSTERSAVVQYNLFHPVWQDQPVFKYKIENIDFAVLFLRVDLLKVGN